MRCVPVLSVSLLAVLLTACGQSSDQQRAEDLAATLAADPVRLKALRARCEADRQAAGEDACRAAAEAFRRRFFAGQTGPEEYRTLAELPPIPASFDTLIDDAPEGDAPLAATEGTP
ncbi:TPA: hypothetical protein I8Y00_003648 [Citrobacter farmeri]|uniref:Lipoprotein n=1 Tax=Citrobacter farmeri TaxID=67824 RepID=A0A8H9NXK0_9ENTR|nr:hypothetical protein [Citrobacter farmeri]NTY15646.1 hypothetical protein [Citrobacter farmeri]HAT1587269.1 hypothetical protein [Citrobacter farmeri]HCB1455845.1 hypothetical protein [Citrobacter farmeri]HCB1609372.1 hypothetical protein [Citrobacter farmeri]